MRRDDDVMVVVDGVRVRRDEADALGIKVPSAPAPAPAPATTDDDSTEQKPAPRKSRTPANKQRKSVRDK